MNVGSLFSGIGGFDLGLERAGMRTVWFCEQDAYCQRVLAKHWPGVPVYSDIRRLSTFERVKPTDVPPAPVDVLCGGFPCQDLSVAGKGAGIDGERSGLWSEYARIIGELRPRYVIVENVPALLTRGFERVLGDLAALGYDAEWDCLPASAFGAPHRRDRVWVVGYPNGEGPQGHGEHGERPRERAAGQTGHQPPVADAEREGREPRRSPRPTEAQGGGALGRLGRCGPSRSEHWLVEPNVGRVANGVPHRVDRLRALGNALVPQIAEWIGHRLMDYERNR